MKDFKRLEERINKEKEITIGDITELGYSRYDINQFIEADIEKLSIGEIELSEDKGIPTFDPIDNPFLHGRFEKQVAEKPDDIALVASDATLTYKQLNEKSNRIAN